jgi:hypothetical protein
MAIDSVSHKPPSIRKIEAQMARTQRQHEERLRQGAGRSKDRSETAQKRQWGFLKRKEQQNRNYINQRMVADHRYQERMGERYQSGWPGADEEEMNEEEIKREFYREKYQSTAQDASAAAAAETPLEESQGGIRGKLAQLRNKMNQTKKLAEKTKGAVEAGEMTTEMANKAIKKGVQAVWMWIHNVLEGASYDFIYLIMFIGPVASLATIIHFVGWLGLGRILTIQMRGIEVPLFPPFSKPEIGVRALNFIVITFLTILVWFIIVFLIWLITDPSGALKAIGAPWIVSFLAKFTPTGLILNLVK